jgi:hypothetical protein
MKLRSLVIPFSPSFSVNEKFAGDGYMVIDDTPRIGVDIDEMAPERFPYQKASLRVNRKIDGTIFIGKFEKEPLGLSLKNT